MIEHTTEVQVRWSDVDPAGVVFYPRFFEWYDLGCESLFASLGLPWPEAFPRYEIVGVPIVESGSKFLSPARYGDVLTIRSKVAWVRTRTFRMEHEISIGARLCSAGFEVRAWVGRPASPGDAGRPTHARTSKPAEQSRAPIEISCSIRNVRVLTHATFDLIVSTSP